MGTVLGGDAGMSLPVSSRLDTLCLSRPLGLARSPRYPSIKSESFVQHPIPSPESLLASSFKLSRLSYVIILHLRCHAKPVTLKPSITEALLKSSENAFLNNNVLNPIELVTMEIPQLNRISSLRFIAKPKLQCRHGSYTFAAATC